MPARPPARQEPRERNPLTRSEWVILGVVFALALTLRLLYIAQISQAPFFEYPMGDARLHLVRAREILSGDLLGRSVFFHSAPVYAYFVAACLWIGGGSLRAVYWVQAVLGAVNCVLIALLARRVATRGAMLTAGLFAAFYGLFAFFDGDLLMIPLTLLFLDAALLLLLRARETGRGWEAAAAGVCFGAAALDRVNLLVFVPVALLFLASGLTLRPRAWRAAPAAAFLLAVALPIAPVTIRNWVVGRDAVLVSANMGVNLFIGNSPGANGRFVPPAGSGLTDPGLFESSVAVAEKALGHRVKPSEASAYWRNRAVSFVLDDPAAALRLVGLKAVLLFNSYEVPNQMNFYFVKAEYGPLLGLMFVGFGLVLPLALGGLALRNAWREPADRLLILFLLVYAATVVAFFVTERYRLPLVPILIVLAARALADAWRALRSGQSRMLLRLAAATVPVALLTVVPAQRFDYNLDRAYNAAALYQAAFDEPQRRDRLLGEAALMFRWVLEQEPGNALARFGLAASLESAGHLREAAREMDVVLAADPRYPGARAASVRIASRLRTAAQPPPVPIPPTPFADAVADVRAGRREEAITLLVDLLRRDPFHEPARRELEALGHASM